MALAMEPFSKSWALARFFLFLGSWVLASLQTAMDLDSARARGDLSAIKRSSAPAPKAPRVPHPDANHVVHNTDAEAWALRVLQRKQEAGETLDAQQRATLERLKGSSGGGGGCSSSSGSGSGVDKRIVVTKGRGGGGEGKIIKVVTAGGGGGKGGGGARLTGKKQGDASAASSSSSLPIGSRVVSRKFGGGGGAEAKGLTTAEKLGMSLDDLAKKRPGKKG